MGVFFVLDKFTPLAAIIQVVKSDFDVEIDTGMARKIKAAYNGGSLIWTDSHLITTDKSQIVIVYGSIEKGGD